jgi:hypothetical protein
MDMYNLLSSYFTDQRTRGDHLDLIVRAISDLAGFSNAPPFSGTIVLEKPAYPSGSPLVIKEGMKKNGLFHKITTTYEARRRSELPYLTPRYRPS